MSAFGFAMKSHNKFLGYTGDFDKAAASCFQTAAVFGVISAVSFVAFVIGAVTTKLSPPPAAVRGDYHAV